MKLIVVYFPYPLIHNMKIWDSTNVIYFCWSPQKYSVDLTATSNSELSSMDTNDDKDQNYQLSTTDDEKR